MIAVSPGDLGVCADEDATFTFWRFDDATQARVMEVECLRCGQFEHWSNIIADSACAAASAKIKEQHDGKH